MRNLAIILSIVSISLHLVTLLVYFIARRRRQARERAEARKPTGPVPPIHGHCRSVLTPYFPTQGHQPRCVGRLDPDKAKPPPGGTAAQRPKQSR